MSSINKENFKEFVLPEVATRIENKVGYEIDEILNIIRDEDFSEGSFEEEYDLEETVDEVYEASEIANKVVPMTGGLGGIYMTMKHQFDANALSYHLTTKATFDTGFSGTEMEEIEIDISDPFELTTVGLMVESEDCTLADHIRFRRHFEELINYDYEESIELYHRLNELENEDNEEELEEFKNALRIACEKTVQSLGILNLKDIPVANLNISLDASDLLETLKDSDY